MDYSDLLLYKSCCLYISTCSKGNVAKSKTASWWGIFCRITKTNANDTLDKLYGLKPVNTNLIYG